MSASDSEHALGPPANPHVFNAARPRDPSLSPLAKSFELVMVAGGVTRYQSGSRRRGSYRGSKSCARSNRGASR